MMKLCRFIFVALISCSIASWAEDVVVRSGDQIELRIGGIPAEEASQVSGTYSVDENGFINLPNLGKIKAVGQTQASLEEAVEDGYRNAQIYPRSNVTINLASAARYVYLGGDVKSPGRIPYTPDLAVLSAINTAGGFTEYAKQNKVRLLRGKEVRIIDVPAIRRDPSKDVPLQPGDQIEVPRSIF